MADSKRQYPSKRLSRISARTGKPMEPTNETKEQSGGEAFQAAERTSEFFDHLRTHSRKAKRNPVEINATIKLILMDDQVYDSGSAVIMNMSPSGALIGNIKLPKKSYPMEPFKIELIMRGGTYDGIGMEALPIRFEHKCGGLGVRVLEIFAAVS